MSPQGPMCDSPKPTYSNFRLHSRDWIYNPTYFVGQCMYRQSNYVLVPKVRTLRKALKSRPEFP